MQATEARPTLIDLASLPPTVSVAHAAKILGWSRSATYVAVNAGNLPHLRVNRRVVVLTVPLLRMLDYDVDTTQRFAVQFPTSDR